MWFGPHTFLNFAAQVIPFRVCMPSELVVPLYWIISTPHVEHLNVTVALGASAPSSVPSDMIVLFTVHLALLEMVQRTR